MQIRRTTKELIADSFLELAEIKDVDKITIKDIVGNCQVTSTTFYNHYKDKYDLIVWIYATSTEKIMQRIGKNGYEWQDALIDGVKYAIENRKFLINAIKHTSGQNTFINHISSINYKVLIKYMKESNVIENLPQEIEVLTKIYVYGTVCTLYEWLINKMPIPTKEFVKLLEEGTPEKLKEYLYKNEKK